MPDPVRILIIRFVALLGAFLVAPHLEKRFGKKAVVQWGIVVVVALALAAVATAILLSVLGRGTADGYG